MKSEKKQLRGTIPYLITIEDNTVTTDYGTSPENDIAIFAIAHKIMYSEIGHFKQQRDSITGLSPNEKKARVFFGGLVNGMRDGLKGCARMLDMLLQNYDGYKKNQEELEKLKDEKHEEIKKYLNDNKVTVENGMLSEKEVDELLSEKFKDLKKDLSPEKDGGLFASNPDIKSMKPLDPEDVKDLIGEEEYNELNVNIQRDHERHVNESGDETI
jgi:hypothetical protein